VRVLAVNAGSTSVKVTVIDAGRRVTTYESLADAQSATERYDAVAHRVVHGAERSAPQLVDDALRAELESLTALAPLHQPAALVALDACRERWPDLPQVACYDTAFHTTIPPRSRFYALPSPWRERMPAYGFHGLSHAWSAGKVAELAPAASRVIVAHIGGGASLCGVLDGRSVVTTMGYTPLDGLVMSTRAGTVDPGVVVALTAEGVDAEDLLARHSGLLGLCGDADMRVVEARALAGDEAAKFALELVDQRVVEQIGRCAAALGGLDALVFTGGVGEHDQALRQRVAERLQWLGVQLHPDADAGEITGVGASVRTFVIAAEEDKLMAKYATETTGSMS
jgi:acetate kinase